MRDRSILDAIKVRLADPEDVARRLDILDGAKPQGRGGRLIRCPAHDDRAPSCSVTVGPDGSLRVRCFGCDLSGDVFDLIAAVERLDRGREFPAVLARAAMLAGIDLAGAPCHRLAPRPPRPAPPPSPPILADEGFAAVVAPLLHVGRLDGGPIAADVCAYLAGRGLLEDARADGWAALPVAEVQRTWIAMLLDAAEDAEGYAPPFSAEDVRLSGLLARGTFAHAGARLLIPWRDLSGRVVNLQRRRIDAGEPRYVGARGRPFPWPYGAERLARVPDAAPVAFVEGAIDALALRALCEARGERVLVLGLPGLAGWRTSWAALARGRVAAVAVDADEAGERAVMRIAGDLADAGARRVERWDSPGSKDWGDTLRGAV